MGAAESKFDYCAACTNDKLFMERYLSSLGLAIVKWVILALPFLGTVVAYFSAGHVFSGYESLIIALLTVEGMALIAGQLYMMFVSLLYVVRRDERMLMLKCLRRIRMLFVTMKVYRVTRTAITEA